MSEQDQQHTLSLVAALMRKPGASKLLAALLLMPVVIGSIIAIATYNFSAVNYFREIDYAKVNFPIVADAVADTQDTLRHHGYKLPVMQLSKQ